MARSTVLHTLAVPAVAAAIGTAGAPVVAQGGDPAEVKEAVEIATDAYVYGCSLVTTDVPRIQMSNVDKAGPLNAPLKQFVNEDLEANWLPAPEGEFIPMLRMYWPKDKAPSILDGSWTPPKVPKQYRPAPP